ncbi:MAG TPA: amino acid ABC transporter permease [Terriglobales bacterium]|nr:amino acid ABC transporter permease [Terriglobales bacterium]
MESFSLYDLARLLLLAARWTVLLSAMAFVGGGIVGLLLLMLRYGGNRLARRLVQLYTELFQSTPLLMQFYLVFFGLPLLGFDVSPMLSASLCLTFYASAYLTEIWRGCVDSVPRGQWDASASVGFHYFDQMRFVILPQALRLAIPPTVGFLVQMVKSTALASIIGFKELTKTAEILTNATFEPTLIYGLVTLIYFALCFPLTYFARALEKKLAAAG